MWGSCSFGTGGQGRAGAREAAPGLGFGRVLVGRGFATAGGGNARELVRFAQDLARER